MDWLFDNLGKLAPVVFFLIYMISSMKKGKAEEEEAFDPEAAERARRIQEEIRRKILERQGGQASETARPLSRQESYGEELDEGYAFVEPEEARYEPPVRPAAKASREVLDSEAMSSSVKRFRDLEEQLAAAERLRDSTKREAALEVVRVSSGAKASGGDLRRKLQDGLADPDSLKTSVLLMEVLGKPVGLR